MPRNTQGRRTNRAPDMPARPRRNLNRTPSPRCQDQLVPARTSQMTHPAPCPEDRACLAEPTHDPTRLTIPGQPHLPGLVNVWTVHVVPGLACLDKPMRTLAGTNRAKPASNPSLAVSRQAWVQPSLPSPIATQVDLAKPSAACLAGPRCASDAVCAPPWFACPDDRALHHGSHQAKTNQACHASTRSPCQGGP